MAAAVLVTNWGGASFMDAAYLSMLQHRNLVQNDNTSAVNAWINAESSQRQDINQQIRQVIYNPDAADDATGHDLVGHDPRPVPASAGCSAGCWKTTTMRASARPCRASTAQPGMSKSCPATRTATAG